MIRIFLRWFFPLFLLSPGMLNAAASDPEALMKRVTEEVLTILREDKSIRSGDRQKAIELIETKVAPHFDFPRMTGLAVGRAWRQADAAQQEALIREFRTLLVRTYANSLTGYRDQTVTFKSTARSSDSNEVTVHSQVNKAGAQPIPLDYALGKTADGWKVFDVSVANVSLVTTYRGSFATEVNRNGVEGLLKSLKEKNRRLETAPPPGVPSATNSAVDR